MAKALSRKVTIYINGKEIENTLSSLKGEMVKLQNQQKKMVIGSEEYVETSLKIREIKSVLREQEDAVRGLGDAWKDTRTKLADFSNMVMGVQSILEMGDAAIDSLKELAKDAAAMDDVYADVMKTTGLTKEQVLSLNEAFGKMDTRTSRDQLNQLAYEAGKLGISSEQAVLGFVSASDKINIALGDVLGEGAMVTIGKLADVYDKSTKQLADAGDDLEKKMLSIGSAINQLGQSSTANEGYMVEFLSRMGGVATQAKLSADAILGYASALDQDMMKQEMSATAFQKFIMQMIKKPAEFAKAARMEVSQFADLMQRDMNEALLRVLEGFQGEGGLIALQPIFEDLGLDAARAASVISSMANSIGEIREAQAIANEELTTGNSIIKEFNTKNNTMQAQAEKAKKAFENMRLELGNDLYPVIIHITKFGTVGLRLLKGVVDVCKENKIAVGSLVVAIMSLTAARMNLHKITLLQRLEELKNKATKQLSILQNNLLARSESKLVLNREKARLETLQEQLAINKKIIADKAEYAAIGANSVVMAAERNSRVLETKIIQQNTIVTNANIAAKKARNAVMRATPWGLVITAATALVGITAKLTKEVRDSRKAMRDIGKEAELEEIRIKKLITSMRQAGEGSEFYKKAMVELNEKYPELLKNLVDERGRLKNIEQAYIDVANAARMSAIERVKSEKIGEKQSEVAESVYEIREKAYKFAQKTFSGNEVLVREYMLLFDKLDGTKSNLSETLKELQKTFGKNEDYYHVRGKSLYRYITEAAGELGNLVKFENELNKKFPTPKILQSPSQATNGETDDEDLGLNPTNEDAEEDAEKAAKAWKKTKEKVIDYISQLEAKAKDGLAEAMEEIAKKAEEMRTSINESTGSEADKKDLLSQLDSAVGEMRKKKVVEYLTKAGEEAEKMRKEFSKPGEDKMFDDIKNASAKLEESLKTIDDKIKDLDTAKSDLVAKKEKATSEELKKSIQGDIDNINNVIAQYQSLSNDVVSNVYRGITEKVDTSKFSKPERMDSGWVSLMAQVDQNVAENASRWSVSKKDSEEYRQKLVEIAKEYDDLVKKLEKNKSVELEVKKAIEERVVSEKKKDPEEQNATLIANLEAEAAAHQANADAIDQEAEKLKKAKEEKDELAKNDSLKKTFKDWINLISDFSDKALTIFSNINKILDNIADKALQEEEDEKEESIKNLDEQLNQGLLSQEEYDKRKLEIEEDFSAKEKEIQLEQWKREKLLNETQAVMSAALAAIQVWADAEMPNWAKIALSASLAAELATNIAAIKSQPEPYAKGGYVNEKTYFMAGEAGEEWVASNRLLRDSTTAPVIDALEQYQRGDKSAFSALRFARPNIMAASNAAASLAKARFQSPLANQNGTDEVVKLMRELSMYLRDPNNRRAVISRETQQRFDVNENFLRSAARL